MSKADISGRQMGRTCMPVEITASVITAALMNNGGCFVISDLCSHDQDWAKANCGDLWLGFEPEELTTWAADAGLVAGEQLFIGLRNGFQIQVREFWKHSGQI